MARTILCILVSIFVGAVPLRAEVAEAPIAMTDPGGQGLGLDTLDVRVAAHGPLALTELEMVFSNPLPRQIEGKFVCMLPTGATVSRFAKEVDGKLVEGEVVERLKATQVYTEVLQSMQDPALLEQDQGNRFKARVFPIPPKGTVRLLIGYSSVNAVQPDGQRRIAVPLRGLPKVGAFRFLAVCRPLPGENVLLADASGGAMRPLGTKDRITYADEASSKDFVPKEDLVLAFAPGPQAQAVSQIAAGSFLMSVFRPPVKEKISTAARDVTVVVDTSASGAASGKARLDALQVVLDELEAAVPGRSIAAAAFDLDVAELTAYKAGEKRGKAVVESVSRRHFLGATDLEKTLAWIGENARKAGGERTYVVVTDGIPTMGAKESGAIVKALGAWPQGAILHVLVIGSTQDEAVTAAIAKAGRGRVVSLPLTTEYAAHAKSAAADLLRPLGGDYQVYDEGAEWIEPREFRDVRPGVELVAFSSLKKGASSQVGATDGKGVDLRPSGAAAVVEPFAPLLEREACRAQLALLERKESAETDAARKAELRRQRLDLSVKHRVVCPLTALLVLESENDFRKYGIDRTALADIMVVGKTGIELTRRSAPAPTTGPAQQPDTATTPAHAPEKMKKVSREGPREEASGSAADLDSAGHDKDGERESDTKEVSKVDRTYGSRGNGIECRTHGTADAGQEPARSGPSEVGEEREVHAIDRLERARAPAEAEAAPEPASGSPGDSIGGYGQGAGAAGAGAPARVPAASLSRTRANVQSGRAHPAPAAPVPALMMRPPPPPPPAQRRDPSLEDASRTVHETTDGDEPAASRTASTGAPAWTGQASWKPTDGLVAKLRKSIEGNPLDRTARNQLGYCLARKKDSAGLLEMALGWQPYDPDNPMVYEYLATAFTTMKEKTDALRATTSIAEISPGDSGLLNRAGFLAMRAGEPAMAETLFRFAIERRPDHVNNYRGLALALWFQGRHEEAVKVLTDAANRDYHGRYGDVKRILREEVGLILGSWIKAKPDAAGRARELAAPLGADPRYHDALRITLHWETDANDVDLHVVDPANEECFYSHQRNRSGLELYEDLTQGLGPETARVPTGRLRKGVYHVGVTYFSAGPMGVSRGIVTILWPTADGKPVAQIEPFCLLSDLEGQSQDLRHVAVVESAGQ